MLDYRAYYSVHWRAYGYVRVRAVSVCARCDAVCTGMHTRMCARARVRAGVQVCVRAGGRADVCYHWFIRPSHQ